MKIKYFLGLSLMVLLLCSCSKAQSGSVRKFFREANCQPAKIELRLEERCLKALDCSLEIRNYFVYQCQNGLTPLLPSPVLEGGVHSFLKGLKGCKAIGLEQVELSTETVPIKRHTALLFAYQCEGYKFLLKDLP